MKLNKNIDLLYMTKNDLKKKNLKELKKHIKYWNNNIEVQKNYKGDLSKFIEEKQLMYASLCDYIAELNEI